MAIPTNSPPIKLHEEKIHSEFQLHQAIYIKFSAGIKSLKKSDADVSNMLSRADQAMYQAKLAGRNRYHLFNAADAKSSLLSTAN